MPGFSLQVKNNAKLTRRSLENLRAALPRIASARLKETSVEIARRMSKPGKKIRYPVNWDSLRQKIKVIIMTMKKQGFLPYIRTEAMQRGWKVESANRGYKVYNNVRGSKYVYGTMRNMKQSNIHLGRWLILRQVYDSVIQGLPKAIKNSLKKVPKAQDG